MITKPFAMILLLATIAAAQQPAREHFKPFNTSDAIYWAGATADLATSLDKREANPAWRDSSGIFSPGRNLAFKGSLWAAFKLLEWKYASPKERRAIAWTKLAVGAVFIGFAVHNAGVEKPRR